MLEALNGTILVLTGDLLLLANGMIIFLQEQMQEQVFMFIIPTGSLDYLEILYHSASQLGLVD